MKIEEVTLSDIALACNMFNSLMPFNDSLNRLYSATGVKPDLSISVHRDSLLKWLNDWGCRHISVNQHALASSGILEWYEAYNASLFPNDTTLWELSDNDLRTTSDAYSELKNKIGARRIRRRIEQLVHIGPTAASKILFAIRPEALMPWDEEMRAGFGCDGSPESYFTYHKIVQSLALRIDQLCKKNGFRIGDLPKKLGRSDSTVIALLNEFIWIIETRKVKLPSSETLWEWASFE